MTTAADRFTVTHIGDYQSIKSELNRRWRALENIPNTFRYKLNVRQQKVIDGRFGFFVQVRIPADEQTRERHTQFVYFSCFSLFS